MVAAALGTAGFAPTSGLGSMAGLAVVVVKVSLRDLSVPASCLDQAGLDAVSEARCRRSECHKALLGPGRGSS